MEDDRREQEMAQLTWDEGRQDYYESEEEREGGLSVKPRRLKGSGPRARVRARSFSVSVCVRASGAQV